MSPWFASALLLLSYDFSLLRPADIEIDRQGTVWVLSADEPSVTRLDTQGGRETVFLQSEGLPTGLAVAFDGRWAVSFFTSGTVTVYDGNDILLRSIPADGPGDLLFTGLDIWVVKGVAGSVEMLGGPLLAAGIAGRHSRLSRHGPAGALLSGTAGVYRLEQGRIPERMARSGSACSYRGGILFLTGDGVLHTSLGDTLRTGVTHRYLSSSPDGGTVVLWGDGTPTVLE